MGVRGVVDWVGVIMLRLEGGFRRFQKVGEGVVLGGFFRCFFSKAVLEGFDDWGGTGEVEDRVGQEVLLGGESEQVA